MQRVKGKLVKSPSVPLLSNRKHRHSYSCTAMEGGERRTSLTSQTVTETLNNSHSSIPSIHQHQAQKMMALKKAYADVILNTAREAAARVMASERRAFGYRHELDSTKDEALRMLLRLKQMIDAKTAEAEMTSLNQQRKIEELEAQLNEAEDVITDLRAELKQVLLKSEKTKNSQVQSLEGQNIEQVASFEESAKPKTSVSSPNQELECLINCDVKNKSLIVNVLDDKCCNSTIQTEQLCISNLEDYFAHDSDFASIIMRSKEPKLCKNGCTQRVRALEGNLLDEKLLTRGVHCQHFGIKNGIIVKDSDEQAAKFSEPSVRTEKVEIKKRVKCHKKPKQKIFSYCRYCFLSSCRIHINENCKSNKGVCSLPSIKRCAIHKWKRKKRRCRNVRMESSVFEHCKSSFVHKQSSSVCDVGRCYDDEYVAKIEQVPLLTNIEPVHGSTTVTESVQAVNKFELVEKIIEKDNELLNLGGSTSQNLTGPSSIMEVEIVDIPPTNTNLENSKAFEEYDGSSGQADASRLLKYTFQRKRKKESLGNPDEKTDSEKSPVKRRVEEKHNGASEPQKSSMIDEPSRDSQCLALVAHELISQSAKRK